MVDLWKVKHGLSKTVEYRTWQDMLQRCFNSQLERYDRYGGRGITVCPRWVGVGGFESFLADMGRRPGKEFSIERKDNDGNYDPGNCVWATRTAQNRNKVTSWRLEYKGKTQTAAEWAREFGINKQTFIHRIWIGWSVQKAIETPVARRVWTKTPGRPKQKPPAESP